MPREGDRIELETPQIAENLGPETDAMWWCSAPHFRHAIGKTMPPLRRLDATKTIKLLL